MFWKNRFFRFFGHPETAWRPAIHDGDPSYKGISIKSALQNSIFSLGHLQIFSWQKNWGIDLTLRALSIPHGLVAQTSFPKKIVDDDDDAAAADGKNITF